MEQRRSRGGKVVRGETVVARMSNIEQGISNFEGKVSPFDIQNSLFDIRNSLSSALQSVSGAGSGDPRSAQGDQARAASEAAWSLSPERAKALMEERARLLARVPPHHPRAAEMLEIATFKLANERYAVEARHVREVLRSAEVTPVPGAPEFLVGLVNLRGDILAVIDLRKILGLAGTELTDLSRIIVLGHERAEFGVLADEVHEVTTVPIDEVLAPPGSVTGIGREFLRGVTKEALTILDGAVLLGDSRLFIHQFDEPGA